MAISTELILNASQRDELVAISQSRSLPAGYAFRAKLILMLAEGASFRTIKYKLGTTAPTIVRWKERFLSGGIDGLDTYHPGQPPSVLTPALHARILAATRKKPADGSTHWSCRKLAAHLGVSKDVVHRVWKETGLKPHRIELYLASDDPDFESKAADIIGLYLNPPRHAAVFCVDEKTAIQALDRLDPVLPLSPGRAERHGFEYYRHGTLSLCGTGYAIRQSARQDRRAPHQPGVCGVPHRGGRTGGGAGGPHHSGQSVGAQESGGSRFSGGESERAFPLHADVFVGG